MAETTWTIGRKIAFGFAVAVVMLFAVGGVAYQSNLALTENNKNVTRSHQVLEAITEVISRVKDAETGQRGFVLTGDEAYLAPYVEATAAIDAAIEELRVLTAEEPRQAARLREVEPLVATKLAELKRSIDARRTEGFDAALKIVDSGNGKVAMDSIRSSMAAMDADERTLLQSRTEAAESGARVAKVTIVVGALVALLFVAVAGVVITRTLGRDLGRAVQSIRSSAVELEASATQQATGAREQATASTEVSTTMSELLATSRQIAESAQRVAHIAGQTATSARVGDQTMQRAEDSIASIQRQIEGVVGHVVELGRKSQLAGGIVEVVEELSEQTNILAINASIEAAGAGEGGRRFAVVAEEIRKLADRVGGSTKEIRTLIEEIRSSVNATVMATEVSTKAVEAGRRQFVDVGAALREISGLVGTTTEAAREIELSTKQQASAVEQVNLAIANVAQTTKEAEVGSTQTLGTVSQLATLSAGLLRIVDASERA